MFELLIRKQEYRNMQESLHELMKHNIIILQTPLDPLVVNSFQDKVNIVFLEISFGDKFWIRARILSIQNTLESSQ